MSCLLVLLICPTNTVAQSAPGPERVQAILTKHCAECHGETKPKGNFRLSQLMSDPAKAARHDRWRAVAEQLRAGTMPPEGKPRLPDADRKAVLDWVDSNARREGRAVLRRLNRVEYQNTLRDLLGIQIDVQDLFPPDEAAAGFDNVGEALHISSYLMERYLEAGERALDLAIANGPQPALHKKRYRLTETHQVKTTTEHVFRKTDDAVICFSSSAWQAVMLSPFYPPDRGQYRFRIASSAVQSDGKPVTFRVDAGTMGMAGHTHLVSYFDATPQLKVTEFDDFLEARGTIRILPYGLASAQSVHKIGADDYTGPGLAIHWIDVEGPLHDTWPPESHRRIFGELPREILSKPNPRRRVEVTSKNPSEDATRILRDFAERAFRRKVNANDVQPYLDLVQKRLREKATFEQAVRAGLLGVLTSPEFLFLREKTGPLDDFALASRLSYFLWSSMPDRELLALAESGKLQQPGTLRGQVERMLKDHKARAFTENFAGQWLGMREIDATVPSHILYPDYDEMLKHSMVQEVYRFFEELLQGDLSVTQFVHSEFSMLNGRLAKHYGIPGVEGWEFRKVALPADSHRGGVMTMAGVLKVTANGTYTSPILRGAWVLDRILGTPPPRPPEGVEAVEPDIRGATTIRQQLAKHRQVATCANCHAKIDPPGFALESYDVIGGWRDFYRTSGNGKAVFVDGKRMHYLQGPKVDPADVLADGSRFANIDEFKKLLLRDPDQLARALTTRLVTYATGAAPMASDQPRIEAIVAKARSAQLGLRTLVHEVVQSELFRSK